MTLFLELHHINEPFVDPISLSDTNQHMRKTSSSLTVECPSVYCST